MSDGTTLNDRETRMFWLIVQALGNCERADDAEGVRQALNEIEDLQAMTLQPALARRCGVILAQRHPLCAQAPAE